MSQAKWTCVRVCLCVLLCVMRNGALITAHWERHQRNLYYEGQMLKITFLRIHLR